jgi:RHS repeat-associated protein
MGNIVQKCSYDAWGNREFEVKDPALVFDRGYTGHEHLDEFGLINMNGRMYDPIVGRFLSPDPYVQAPDFSQSFNRYSYALNNPLKYTDPTGEFLWTILTGVFDFLGTAFFKGGLDPTSKSARQNAWRNYDPTASWSNTNKAFQIDLGLFRTDENKNFWGRTWELISRHTWQAPQTIIGYTGSGVQNLFGGVRSVTNYGGATVVETYGEWKKTFGVTFGCYILGERGIQADPNNSFFQHEYGHYLQSQAVGVFYLGTYGLPSANSHGDHNAHPVEQDANIRAFKYFNKHIEGYNGWDFTSNTIIGYDPSRSYNDPENQDALRRGQKKLKIEDYFGYMSF